ncbi:MAG: helix-turn-helix domain-containing protein [archaeon]|nr:helix-turn-helix domain-containing protein [archaeon]
MSDYFQALIKFGLSEKEANVFLACLNLGESSANEIALKSSVPRTLTYDILERLLIKGLVSYEIKENKKYFIATNPIELLSILKEKEIAIKQALPDLIKIHQAKGIKRPKVELFVGKEGMKTVMNDILASNIKEFLSYGSSRSSYDIIPAFMEQWHKDRAIKKIVMKILYNNTLEAKEKVKQFKKSLKLTEYKFSPIKLESPTATLIYLNKVVMQSWTEEPFAVIIHSQELADNQRAYFKELWKISRN